MPTKLTTTTAAVLVAILLASGCSLVEDLAGDLERTGTSTELAATGGTLIVRSETVPAGQAGSFQFTGVPTGTISSEATLIVADLAPGTYTTTEVNPAPDFDVSRVECDDGDSTTASSGDATTRTAVFNLDPGETITCTFTNTRRGSLVVAGRTIPDGAGGSFQYTGVPSGTIPSNGTLVVSNLTPGTYTTTEVDPAPDFDLAAVECDDVGSATASSGDPSTRTAVFNLDPGELITCTFTNARRGVAVVASRTVPDGANGSFQFTGVPSGTVPGDGTLVVANLTPGTYTTTEVDPAPDFDLTAVECDDGSSNTVSLGDAATRTAIFNIDPGETVTCTFTNSEPTAVVSPTVVAGGSGSGSSTSGDDGSGPTGGRGINPFQDPDDLFDDFPLPADLPPGSGTFNAPKAGPWSVTNFAGQMNCGSMGLPIAASPPETGVLEVLDGGNTLVGTGLQDAQGASITLRADPNINGRYTGTFQGMEQGVPVTINYFWQVVTDEYIVGFLTASVTAEGVSCAVYRSFEMHFSG